jgi:hypothetical protein
VFASRSDILEFQKILAAAQNAREPLEFNKLRMETKPGKNQFSQSPRSANEETAMVAHRFGYRNIAPAAARKHLSALVRNLASVGLGLGLANCAFGQLGQTSSFGQLGGMGQTGIGQTSVSGLGQMGLGQTGGMGQTGSAGQAGFGQTGQAGQAAANPFGSGGMLGSANSFGGLAGAALLNRGLQGGMGATGGMGAMGGRGGMGGMGGRGGMNSFNQNQNRNSNKPQIRATVKLGFEVMAPTSTESSRMINDRLQRNPSSAFEGVTVAMSGRTAVLRGAVNSPADGKLLERLLSLEPGVDAVENELTFAEGESDTPLPTTPLPPSLDSSTTPAAARNSANAGASAGRPAVQATPPAIVPPPVAPR